MEILVFKEKSSGNVVDLYTSDTPDWKNRSAVQYSPLTHSKGYGHADSVFAFMKMFPEFAFSPVNVPHMNSAHFRESVHLTAAIEDALTIATEVHQGVVRDDGKCSYLEQHIYPVGYEMALLLEGNSEYENGIITGLLHDTIEDGPKDVVSQLENRFPQSIYCTACKTGGSRKQSFVFITGKQPKKS
jgi:hypothetical protein